MPEYGKLTLTIHGLDENNGAVRADVFAKELRRLVDLLKAVDKQADGEVRLDYFIEDLAKGSAVATVRETPCTRSIPLKSAVFETLQIAKNIYEAKPHRASPAVLRKMDSLCGKVATDFKSAEIGTQDNVIRIDTYFADRVKDALRESEKKEQELQYFSGTTLGTFDGVLKAVDLRKRIKEANLILSAGGAELKCYCQNIDTEVLGASLDKRVLVSGLAHYTGEGQLPKRIDVQTIRTVKASGDLERWVGHLETDILSEEVDEGWSN